MEISTVLEGAVTRLSNCEVISGATERSSLRVIDANELGEESEMHGGSECESGGCQIGSGMSREHLGTAGGREGVTESPGGDCGGCA